MRGRGEAMRTPRFLFGPVAALSLLVAARGMAHSDPAPRSAPSPLHLIDPDGVPSRGATNLRFPRWAHDLGFFQAANGPPAVRSRRADLGLDPLPDPAPGPELLPNYSPP